MAVIPNFPQNLLDMHHHWHDPTAHPGSPGGRVHPFGTTGGGLEFLQFHHDYMAQFHAWYDTQPFGTAPFNTPPFQTGASAQAAVVGWTSVPAALKNGAVTGWGGVQIAQEARLTTLTPGFSSDDDIGNYIEGGIHGWIHGAAAAAFNEPVVGTFHSPQSTYFYGIHGLVDYWWQQWRKTQKPRIKDLADAKFHVKEFKDHKEIIKEGKELRFEKLQLEKPFKEKDKDIFEGGGVIDPGDPAVLAAGVGRDPLTDLHQRLTDLETKFTQRAFIDMTQRPAVGAAAHAEGRRDEKGAKKDRT
jgi:hypothetical protein